MSNPETNEIQRYASQVQTLADLIIGGQNVTAPFHEVLERLKAILAVQENGWLPIESAAKDGTEFVAYCPAAHGLPHMASLCSWHEDAGFCVDELREPTHWRPLPDGANPPDMPR